MSNTFLNLRIGLWHFQIDRDFRCSFTRNVFHEGKLGKESPWMEFYR